MNKTKKIQEIEEVLQEFDEKESILIKAKTLGVYIQSDGAVRFSNEVDTEDLRTWIKDKLEEVCEIFVKTKK